MVIKKHNFTGYWARLHWNNGLVNTVSILGIMTISPVPWLLRVIYSSRQFFKDSIYSHSFREYKFRSNIMGESTFKINLCGRVPGEV